MTAKLLHLMPATAGGHASGEGRRGPARVARAQRLLPSLRLILILVGLFAAAAAAAAVEPLPRLPGLWGDFGAGFGNLDTSAAPYGDSGGAVLVDLTVGARVSDHWLVGVNLSGGGSQISNRNYDSYDRYSSVYGQLVSNLFLSAQFEPDRDQGWLVRIAGGHVYYHSRDQQYFTGEYRSGEGSGGMLSVGYDWPFAGHAHLETHLDFEAGRVSLSSLVGGSFSYHTVGLSVHIAYH